MDNLHDSNEPVAWINWSALTGERRLGWQCESELASEPLYTSPPTSKPWVGLTDDDHQAAWDAMSDYEDYDTYGAVLEAKLREKNA